jgi:hypothetical protein
MALEQVPGNLDLKLVKGDDFNISFNIPFDATSYVWATTIYDSSGTSYTIPTTCTVQSSILSIVRTTFLASTTSKLTPISDNDSHAINISNSSYWKIKYVDSTSLTRTFISGYLEVVEIVV